MNQQKIYNIEKNIFSANYIKNVSRITLDSAKVAVSLNVKNGSLIRLKRDLFVTSNRFNQLSEYELFEISNILQTSS